jgi:hypothetical protein
LELGAGNHILVVEQRRTAGLTCGSPELSPELAQEIAWMHGQHGEEAEELANYMRSPSRAGECRSCISTETLRQPAKLKSKTFARGPLHQIESGMNIRNLRGSIGRW